MRATAAFCFIWRAYWMLVFFFFLCRCYLCIMILLYFYVSHAWSLFVAIYLINTFTPCCLLHTLHHRYHIPPPECYSYVLRFSQSVYFNGRAYVVLRRCCSITYTLVVCNATGGHVIIFFLTDLGMGSSDDSLDMYTLRFRIDHIGTAGCVSTHGPTVIIYDWSMYDV